MFRALPLLLLGLWLGACRTTTRGGSPPPQARWELPLELTAEGLPFVKVKLGAEDVRLLVDTGATQTTLVGRTGELQIGPERVAAVPGSRPGGSVDGVLAVHHLLSSGALVLDFPGRRLLALDGFENTWLRWLDERSPKGELAGVARLPPMDGGLLVQTRVGDGPEVTTLVSTAALRSVYSRGLFDSAVLDKLGQNGLAGVHVKVRDAEFGPLTIDVLAADAAPPGRLGLDVLKGVVLVVPVHDSPRIWFMTPRE